MDSVFDSWGEYNRECTSAVAWWLHERNGFEMPFHDNASGWGPDAQSRGYAVNGTPAVGAVAWWGPGDHVAWVAAVGAGTVTIEEYNYDYAGHYHERTIPSSYPSGYIHFKDLPSGPPGEGSFVGHNGFVYRLAGGAPVYVSNWAAVGGPQPVRNLSDAEFATLPQYPRDGTLLGGSDGRVYVVAGGAPLWVSNWAAIGGPQPSIGIDGAAVAHAGEGVPWDHLRSYPADGTLLGSSDGRVYVVAGGAPLWVSNWAAIGGPQP
ncbi:MAG TPA: CHAP domain-containing protein, partial [Solirubrobacterales bacterium]|nr:CHAP domain-containing protein [Solirubrobacterales bacterium]